tara:strand:+ start:1477 stop:2442 length:966 start_codon:yes stop_codon:yes gene_type:complete
MSKYYPKSQIITNQYSLEGNNTAIEGILVYEKTTTRHTGFFHYTSKGKYFSGKTPEASVIEKLEILSEDNLEDSPSNVNSPLKPFKSKIALFSGDPEPDIAGLAMFDASSPSIRWSSMMVINYMNTLGISYASPPTLINPYHNPEIPTEEDYKLGSFIRYFSKSYSTKTYIEIDKSMFEKIISKNSNVPYELYQAFSIPWTLIGKESQVKQINQDIVSLTERKKKLVGLQEYFRNKYLQHFSLHTVGGEFLLPNGQAYVGLYHIHPDKGPMVGKTHLPTSHDILTPINQEILISGSFTSTNVQQSDIYKGTNVTPPTSTGY